jgi:hypothetical protein
MDSSAVNGGHDDAANDYVDGDNVALSSNVVFVVVDDNNSSSSNTKKRKLLKRTAEDGGGDDIEEGQEHGGEKGGQGHNMIKPDNLESANDGDNAMIQQQQEQHQQQPDNVPSAVNEDDDPQLVFSDGEFPTIVQLTKILASIETWKPKPSTSVSDKKEILDKFELLESWALHDDDNNNNDDKDKLKKKLDFKIIFLELGGLLRMAVFIENYMDNLELVAAAAEVCHQCLYHRFDDDDNDEAREIFEVMIKSVYRSFERHGCFRILILALEECIPITTKQHVTTACAIWQLIRSTLVGSQGTFLTDVHVGAIVGMAAHIAQPTSAFITERITIMEHVVHVLITILQDHKDAMVDEQRYKNLLGLFRIFIEMHPSEWLDDESCVAAIAQLCAVNFETFSVDDIQKWLPFLTAGLSKYFTNDNIIFSCFAFIEKVEQTIDHRELDKTPLSSTLLNIAQSEDGTDQTKTKCRFLVAKLMM